jgi:hypothetical protein
MILIISFLAHQILRILGSQIETQKIFSFNMYIFTNLRRCHLQLDTLEKLFFVNKNWPNDSKIDCKPHSNLVKMIDKDLDFEEKLKKFEGSFERDELVDI